MTDQKYYRKKGEANIPSIYLEDKTYIKSCLKLQVL